MDQYIGEIRQVAFTFAPVGWLMCDGSLQSISNNEALFTLLGTAYGGDGMQTFGMPDLRGRCPLGQGSGPNGSYSLGQMGGTEAVTLNSGQLPAHNHSVQASSQAGSGSPAGNTFAPSPGQYQPVVTGSSSGVLLTSTGGDQQHENRMPFLAINYIIATDGIYPSQN